MAANYPDSIDNYIAGFPEETQEILQQIRSTISNAASAQKRRSAMVFRRLLSMVIWFTLPVIITILVFIRHHRLLKHLKKNYQFIKTLKVQFNFQ